MTEPTLTVYKASAGSGKTFTLAKEYIKLLIENPEAYRNILAVTFTNKATEEMKMRILSQLYGLWKQLPDSESYMASLEKDFSQMKNVRDFISQQAGKALRSMLDNYHFFRVQTIDAFFQTVLRNLAHELQLNANLRVGLNQEQVVDEAVDTLIDSIADDNMMRNVVMGYVKERLNNNESWNFIKGIKEFGANIFRDFYKEHREQLIKMTSDENFFINFKTKLNDERRKLEKKYQAIGEEAMLTLENNGLTITDFKHKNGGAIGYFIKLNRGEFAEIDMDKPRMKDALNSEDSWIDKKSANCSTVADVVKNNLLPLMTTTERCRTLDARKYNSIKKTLEHVNDVQLLRYIEDFSKELNNSAQRFMLSDTPTLLNAMIKEEDSPFIYEKIGAHLEHIMIDEFQDTSTTQWNNFRKLLEECMAQGKSNLLVGDVKQSIYRWRSGDWRLLNNIENTFKPGMLKAEPLKTNYRSSKNVVLFNNHFLKRMSDMVVKEVDGKSHKMAEELRKAYDDVEQLTPKNREKKGLVHIDLIPKEQEDSMEERTLEIITTLTSKGAKLKDIAILLRGNKEAITMATYLEREGISVVSAEAFELKSSAAVRIIIGAMRHLIHPKDTLTLKLLLKDSGMTALPQELEDRRELLLTMSLHDMAEEILRIFNLGEKEGAYITTFFDHLRAFCNDTSTVLEDFLEAWDDELQKKTIETPDCDGVRILTIHKSKGLEFKHVILPYCNWKLELRSTLWCEPNEAPFNELPIVPLNYTSVKAFENTIYKEVVTEEHVQNIVDNLNLVYVAMTRACDSLFIIGIRGAAATQRSQMIEETIKDLHKDTTEIDGTPLHYTLPDVEDEAIELTYGSLDGLFNEKETEESQNAFLKEVEPVEVKIASYERRAEFRQSNKSLTFADDAIDETDRQRYIRMGTVMHQIFSEIKTTDDVEPVLTRMEFDGTLYDDGMTREGLVRELQKKFQNPQVKNWFSGGWTLYNECAIIDKEGEQRPDRVMTDGKETIVVDFKFGKPHNDYHAQVERYKKLLEDMGMPGVKGYLWYVTLNKIEEV